MNNSSNYKNFIEKPMLSKSDSSFKVSAASKLNENSKNKSIVDTLGEQILQLSAPEISFVNTEPNELYEISINVRNVSQFSQKIKVKRPQCAALAVTASREGNLAAGLDLKLTVVFDSKENVRISDRVVVATENLEIEIPVNVYPNIGKLEFEPFLNFGFVRVGTEVQSLWHITNKAENQVSIKLTPLLADQSAKLELSNSELTLQGGEKKAVKLTLCSKTAGTVEGSIEIEPKSINYSTLEFVANFCEYSRMLSDAEGKEIKVVQIDPLFGGETMQTSAFLVNNSPQRVEFRVTRKKGAGGEDTVSLITPEQIGKDDSEKLVQFRPSQGELEAYTSTEIKATVMAKYDEIDQQIFCNYILGKNVMGVFEKEWTYTLRTHLNYDEQHLDLPIKGTSMVPQLSINPTYLEFPNTPLQHKIKKTLKIQNFSSKAAVIQMQNSANYSFLPQKLKIQPKESTTIEVLFGPKKVGDLNQICCLNVGVFSFPIKVFGKCTFAVKGDSQNLLGEEIPVEEFDRSGLEQQISVIQKGRNTSGFPMADLSKNSIHFDSYRQASSLMNQSQEKSLHVDVQKRTRVLRNKTGKEQKFDSTSLNANQPIDVYPSAAKNQQEQRLISKELTSLQLRNIIVGPVVIEMGTVLLRSTQKKYFHICNFNQKPIAIRLETSVQSFAETSEERQILPAESRGGFPITFEALSEGPFKYTLQYVLNGSHFFQMMVTGTTVLPSLVLSRNKVQFTIGEEDRKFEKKEILKLQNPFDYEVSYEWSTPANSQFVIEPSKGAVKAHSFVNTGFVYNFEKGVEPGQKIEESMKLKITYGKNVEVKCSALIPESPCVCKIQEIQFKEVAIGRICQSKIHIKNMSKVSTIYRVNIPKDIEHLVTVGSKTGSILAEEMAEISFKFTSSKTLIMENSIQIAIRGSKNIELPVKAKAILPQVRVEADEIDFGNVPVEGNPAEKEVALINQSSIPVDLELRLHNETFLAKCLRLGSICDNSMTIIDSKDLKTYKVIYLRVAAKCRTVFTLRFEPQIADDYQFYLPLFLPNAEPMDNLQRVCRCKGVKNRLMALTKEVVFGKIVIEQAEQIYCKSQLLEIFNPQEDVITWWVDETGLAPFRLDKKSGRLEGYEKCQIKIFFSAQAPGEYTRDLKFFIDQAETDISKCYMKVQFSASACFPTLYFDQPYLILPTVSCGQVSTSVFQIFNGGYENINLKYAVIQQFSNIDLGVRYLNGSNLGVTRKQIKVEVSFVSDKPVSFTIKLSFYDNNGRTFTINVSGTADTHTYTIIDNERNMAGWQSSLEKSCQFLKHYINSTGHLNQELYEFPKSLIDNDYQKLSVLLSNYSQAFDKARSQVKKNAKTFFSFQYISEVIKLLKAEGAFLNHIRPEMLLTYEEYLQNIKIRADNNLTILAFYKKKERNQFDLQQKQGWLILFYQIFKVFSRINPGKLKANAQFWLKFQVREKLLISWLEKTYLSEAGIELQGKTSQILSNINNCELLSAMISKYTNIKILQCYGKNVKNFKEKEKRCKTVIDTFSQIGINCLFRVEDLLRSNQKEMLLVLENLYLILPSYLQKGQPIVFSCQFGQVVTKSVEITNPSKYQLTYLAKIEGSKAYTIDEETEFQIDSKKTHEIKIKYISNMNMNNSSATLTLTGQASNKFTPSTFIFVLKSNNLGRVSEKAVQVTGNIYEQLDFSIKVTNNFTEDADFKIELVPSSKAIYSAFYLPVNSIKIKKGETMPLNMIFIPFMAESQQVVLIFRDEKVGEFQYELNGTVENNVLCQEVLRVPQTLFTNKKYTIELPVPTRNDLLFRARKAAEFLADRLQKKSMQKDQLKQPQQMNYSKYYPKLSASQTFTAKLTTPNNSIVLKSDQIVIKDIDTGDDPAKRDDQKLVFEINLKSAIKQGSFTVGLKNVAGTDIRKYKVTLSAVSKPLRYELEMKTPTNKPLTQPLPLINLAQEKNVFHVVLVPANEASRSVFSIDQEREVTVEPKEQGIVNLAFKPRQLMTYNAILKVENVTAAQNVQYEIVGVGEDPETESISFEQEVRKQKMYSIKLPITRITRCTVQSFQLVQAQYQKIFQCSPESPAFKFKINPKMSGKLEGKLIIETDQVVLAYKIIIHVKNTIEGEVKMRTVQRKEVSTSIVLPVGQYRVSCEDYNLKYPSSVTITQERPSLELSYYSSKPQQKQILLSLISDTLGEMTYLLKVIVEPMPEIKIQPFQIELGKMHRQKIIFQNTDDVEMTVSCKCSHPSIFFPEIQKFTVPPRSTIDNAIIYRASSLQIEEGKLYFVSDRSAKWTYHLSGYGLPQVKPEIREMTVNMGEHICEPITFRNPLNKTLQYIVTLQNTEGEQAFSMIMKSTKIDLDYNQQFEIPVTVKPKAVSLNKAILKIFVNQKISWKYQLRAKTIYISNEEPKIFKIQCREKVEQLLELPLPYGQQYNGQSVKLHVVNAGDPSDNSLMKNAIKIAGGKETVVLTDKVVYPLTVMSFKPKNIVTFFQILAENGCKWVYKVKFSFLPPPVDDELEIATGINKPASVKFKLTNRMKTHAKFRAFFSSDSSVDFSVNPKNGELEPYGREGTSIEVVFCPTQYKKSWSGKLIIQTDESYWSYDVRGVLPHYNPPVGKSSLKQ